MALSLVKSENVTTTVAPVAKYNDVCTNECSGTDPNYWCGVHKSDSSGKAMRCVQYTVYGRICVGECAQKSEHYYWCLTNDVKMTGRGSDNWWDHCSLEGSTTNKKQCTDSCGKRGEKYFWCHTSTTDTSEWDYCSPKGRVKPIQNTVKGSLCISECAKKSKKYYWCYMSYTCNSKNCADNWDYCSPDAYHTRYNEKCKRRCSKGGQSYYWCYKDDENWDYCSPKVKLGADVSEQVELTIYGVKCMRKCGQYGKKYYWCRQQGGSQQDWWDYCSPSSKKTITNDQCKDSCLERGSSYFWCHTSQSWDYCSPASVHGGSRQWESRTPVFDWVLFLVIMVPAAIIIVAVCRS